MEHSKYNSIISKCQVNFYIFCLFFCLCCDNVILGVIQMTTGQRIRSARKQAGLTQKELGKKLGLSFQSVAQWENDLRNPKKETLERIADALGVSFFDLLGNKERAIYERGVKEGTEGEEWLNNMIDAFWKQEGYTFFDIEVRLINAFSQLNDDGQKKAVERVKELTEIPRYQATPAPESTPAPQNGTDTTPPPDAPQRPQKDET